MSKRLLNTSTSTEVLTQMLSSQRMVSDQSASLSYCFSLPILGVSVATYIAIVVLLLGL